MKNNIFIITTTLFYNDDGEIFIVKRNNKPYFGFWSLPGGKLEFKEKIDDGNKREIYEELGYKIESCDFFKMYEFFDIGHAIVFCYTKKINNKDLFNKSLKISEKEISNIEWVPFSKINPSNFPDNHYFIIKDIFNNKLNK